MKKKEIHGISDVCWKRLVIMARHLNTCRYNDYREIMQYYCDNDRPPCMLYQGTVYFLAFPFLYVELPKLFEEWEYLNRFDITIYIPEQNIVAEQALMRFFGLKPKQYMQCFVAYAQSEKFAKPLHGHSGPKDISYNIICFLNSLSPNFSMRTVLIEKVSADYLTDKKTYTT